VNTAEIFTCRTIAVEALAGEAETTSQSASATYILKDVKMYS
jgi:hypothetical protein